MNDIDRAFYDLAIKERDYERVANGRLRRELAAAQLRIQELERELLLVPCVSCSGMSREQWEAMA